MLSAAEAIDCRWLGRAMGSRVMKYMVEFHIKPGNKNRAWEAFEQRGPSRNPGVTFRGAWIGNREDVIFVLAESTEEALVTQAAKSWSESGDFRLTEVIDIEQY
jgi:hypothetical protein